LDKLRKFTIFFSKFIKSPSLKALASESIGTRCLVFLKFSEGLKPKVLEGEFLCFKKLYFLSNSRIFFF